MKQSEKHQGFKSIRCLHIPICRHIKPDYSFAIFSLTMIHTLYYAQCEQFSPWHVHIFHILPMGIEGACDCVCLFIASAVFSASW